MDYWMYVLIVIVAIEFIVGYIFIQKLLIKWEKESSSSRKRVKFFDVNIIFEDGTLYRSYKNINMIHIYKRIYNFYTDADEKEFIARIDLGTNMTMESTPSSKEENHLIHLFY